MHIVLAVIAWALIGVIEGAVAPMIVGSGKDRLRATIPAGIVVAVAVGAAAGGTFWLIDGDQPAASIYGTIGAIVMIATLVLLLVFERRHGTR